MGTVVSITDADGKVQTLDDAPPLDEVLATETDTDAADEDLGGLEANPDAEATDESSELVVSLGDQAAADEDAIPDDAPAWVKKTRDKSRETAAENKQLRRQIEALQPAVQVPALPPKPTMDSVDNDVQEFEKATDAWHDQKRKVDEFNAKAEADKATAQKAWDTKLATYEAERNKLKVGNPDMDKAHAAVIAALPAAAHQNAILRLQDPAVVVLALGRNEAELRRLSAITDFGDYLIALGEIKGKLKVTKKSAVPAPEVTGVRGTKVAHAGPRNAAEEAAIKKAMDSGNIDAYRAIRKQQAERQAAK